MAGAALSGVVVGDTVGFKAVGGADSALAGVGVAVAVGVASRVGAARGGAAGAGATAATDLYVTLAIGSFLGCPKRRYASEGPPLKGFVAGIGSSATWAVWPGARSPSFTKL